MATPLPDREPSQWPDPPVDRWADELARAEVARARRMMLAERARGAELEEILAGFEASLNRLTDAQRRTVLERLSELA